MNKFLSNLISKKIFQDFSWVSLGSVISALFSLLFMKMVALHISPSIYGTYSLHVQILLLLNTVVFLPFLQAFFKFYKAESNQKDVFAFYNTIFILLFFIVSPPLFVIFKLFFHISFFNFLIFFIFLFFTVFLGYLRNILYIQREQKTVAIANIVLKVFPFLLIFLLAGILFFKNELVIWFSQIAGLFFAVSFLVFVLVGEKINFSFAFFSISNNEFKNLLKKNLKYALPLLFFGIFSWINGVADRYIIDFFLNKREVGIYSAGYGISSQFMMLMGGIVLSTVKPVLFDIYHKNRKQYFVYKNKLILFYILTGLCVVMLVFFFSKTIGLIFLSEKYKNSFGIISLISFAYFIVNLVYLIEVYFYISGKTKYLLYASVLGAVFNVIFNIIFIPIYKINGAAFATIAGFSIQFFIVLAIYVYEKRGVF